MGCPPNGPTTLYEDNNSCIAQTENPLHHKRTKHIDIAYHLTRQMVEENVVRLERVDSENQLADMFTKPLGPMRFQKLFKMLNMRATSARSTGDQH